MTGINIRDLLSLAARRWWVIALSVVCGTAVGATLALRSPPVFTAEGSFYIAETEGPAIWRSLSSPQLFEKTISSQGLQATVSCTDLQLCDVQFCSPQPVQLELIFTDGERYQLSDGIARLNGTLGEPLHHPAATLTLKGSPNPGRALQRFCISLQPTDSIISSLRSSLSFFPAPHDPQLLQISYSHPDPSRAAQVVNAVMAGCEQIIAEESHRKAAAEVAYLQEKQQELLAEIEGLGAPLPSEQERVYLSSLQENYRKRQGQISVELAALDNVLLGVHAPRADQQLNALAQKVRAISHQRQALLLDSSETLPRLQLCGTSELACSVCGLDPEEVRRLFVGYAEGIEKARAETAELRHLLEALPGPYFNVSALTDHLQDPVSAALITRASEILLTLADEGLHYPEERLELRQELAHFKGLLTDQLTQKLHTREERLARMKEELLSLQKAQVEALDYHLVNLQEQLHDQVSAQQDELNGELTTLQARLAEIDRQLAPPQEDRRAQQAALLSKTRVEALSQLIDEKTRAHHSLNVASGVITPAQPGVERIRPHLASFTATGGGAGLLLGCLALWTTTLFGGTLHSPAKLRHLGIPIAGRLSRHYTSGKKLADSDLEVLRNAWSLLDLKNRSGIAPLALIVPGQGPDFSGDLASLLAQQGERVLLVRCSFHEPAKPEESPGLIHYLKGGARSPKLITKGRVDTISAGGTSRYAVELLGSPRFDNLIRASRKRYGFVLISSYGPIDGAQVRLLQKNVDRVLVGLGREPLPSYLQERKAVVTLR